MKFEFDECAIDQPSIVLEETKLDEVYKIDTMVFSMAEEKMVSFPTSIPHNDFVIPNKFNDLMDSKNSFFFVLPMVILDLKQVLRAQLLILRYFKTRGRVFSNQGIMIQGEQPIEDFMGCNGALM